jgi:hypothetical protein
MGRPALVSDIECVYCGGFETCKGGFSKGVQRYQCRACRRVFIEKTVRPVGRASLAVRLERQARRDAGVNLSGPAAKELPSEGRLILTLRALAQRFGRTPTTNQITAHARNGRSYPLDDYYRVFGTYLEALRRAGLPSHYKKTHDKDALIGELRELREKLKRPIFGRDVADARKKGRVSPISHFQRTFGSVPKAIEAAGAGRKVYTRDEMIAVLRKLDAKLDRPVVEKDINALYRVHKGPNSRAIEREFGGMNAARKAAGIKSSYKRVETKSKYWCRYTPEELIAQLKRLGELLGRKPTDRDLNEYSKKKFCAAAVTFARMFGSLPDAYRRAGFELVKPSSYTDDEIVAALASLAREFGRMPTYHEIRKASMANKCPSPGTIMRRLGRLTELKERFDEVGAGSMQNAECKVQNGGQLIANNERGE